jgi:hypothetical protein
MIKKEEKMRLVELCKRLIKSKGNSYIESFTIQDNLIHNNLPSIKEEVQKNIVANSSQNQPIDPICEIPKLSPMPLDAASNGSVCIQNSNCCSLCSGTNDNPCNIIAPVPGPQWLPSSAETVQNNLKNNVYTPTKCSIN